MSFFYIVLGGAIVQDDAVSELLSLPYAAFVEETSNNHKISTTIYDENLASEGYVLYAPIKYQKAWLINKNGSVLHSWTYNRDGVHVELGGDGFLYVISAGFKALIKLDWNSEVKQIIEGSFHHDFTFVNNSIFILSGVEKESDNDLRYYWDESIVQIMNDGSIKRNVSIVDIFIKEPSINKQIQQRINKIKGRIGVLHTNTLEYIDKDIEGVAPEGSFLIGMRNINLIAIVDIDSKEILWSYGPDELHRPHHPTFLENGNLLIFDNKFSKNSSRIIEVDPLTKDIVWEYQGSEEDPFYSDDKGSNQRLSNGNTLITESNNGRVFEVTSEGKIVWEYWIPEFDEGKRRAVYRAIQYDEEKFKDLDFNYGKKQ